MNLVLRDIIIPALVHLPPKMSSIRAQVMLLAIGLQESNLEHRYQKNGPAHGLWQFERIGVAEVLRNPKTRDAAIDLCWKCGVAATTAAVYHRIDDDDILAAGIARLALWRHNAPLPGRAEADKAWGQYIDIWAPGRPRKEKWAENYERAWDAVLGTVTA